MRANRGRDTGPELALRRAVHARGLRYFVNRRPIEEIRRTADMVFPTAKVAVFLDGCFWHGCPTHHTVAATNADFWAGKIRRTLERDEETNTWLIDAGWIVVRCWEHDAPDVSAVRVENAVRSRLDSADK